MATKTSLSNTSTGSNLTWSVAPSTTGSSNTYTIGSSIDYSNFINYSPEAQLKDFIEYFKEDELCEILDRILASASENDFKKIIRTIVRSRHFSEEFLSKYLSYLTKGDILQMHRGDIKSSSYPTICLYFETKEDGDGPEGMLSLGA